MSTNHYHQHQATRVSTLFTRILGQEERDKINEINAAVTALISYAETAYKSARTVINFPPVFDPTTPVVLAPGYHLGYTPQEGTIAKVLVSCAAVGTVDATFDIKRNGVSLTPTPVAIAAGDLLATVTSFATGMDVFDADDLYTIDVVSHGTTISGLAVTFVVRLTDDPI